MKIVVCVKQVEVVAARSAFEGAQDRLAAGHVIHALNPFDEVAVEEALRIRDGHGGGDVTVVSVGPPRAAFALRHCLAMGADGAVHVVDESCRADDPWTVAGALARVVRGIGCDLILCGLVAVDDGMGVVGTFLAELLGLPVVTGVVKIELRTAARLAFVQRALDRGDRESVECHLPAVLTADKGLNRPRYPTLAGRRRAAKLWIRTVALDIREGEVAGRGESPVLEIVGIAPPKIRPRRILAPDDDSSAAGRLQWILAGGRQRRGGGRVVGDPGELADGIVAFLRERRLLPIPPRRRGRSPAG